MLPAGLRLVFCGSAAGTVSAQRQAYYAGPGNKFWPTLFETGLTPRLFSPEEYQLLPNYGIGFTDMAKNVFGSDASLPKDADDPERVYQVVKKADPKILAFVGKRSAQVFFKAHFGLKNMEYGIQQQTVGSTKVFVLPSPSGLAVRYWTITPWQALAAHLE
ncbi:MAG: mismatch-specific DNA-glycosylase [Alphaproteobacteria bacterium]|nr:mismatch-specific DNA-glycosylase [Alphaproteobacteria bacterium]